MNKKSLKPYVGALAVILFAADIFWFSGLVGRWSDTGASFIGEALLAVISVLLVLVFRADLKEIFPFKLPDGVKIAGTLVFWIGCFITAIVTALFVAWLFPGQVEKVLQSGGAAIGQQPFWIDFAMVCLMPAICEELAFRGILLGSLRGIKSRWVIIVIVSAVFGVFHGSFWRFFPTALLGAGMAYLLLETGNMVYNMLFHMVNNLIPLLLMRLFSRMIPLQGMTEFTAAPEMTRIPLAAVGIYMLYGAGAPMLLYMGHYLIHAGEAGYRSGLFPREKDMVFTAVTASCFGLAGMGILLIFLSFAAGGDWIGAMGR